MPTPLSVVGDHVMEHPSIVGVTSKDAPDSGPAASTILSLVTVSPQPPHVEQVIILIPIGPSGAETVSPQRIAPVDKIVEVPS